MSYAQPTTAHRSTERNDSLATYERASAKRQDLIARAGKMGPKAIAQARSDKERDLLAAIFVAIPEVLRLSDVHGRIDAEGGDDDLAHRRWCRARYRLEGLARQLIKLPAEDAASAARRLKLHGDIFEMSEIAPNGSLATLFPEDVLDVAKASMKALNALAVQPDRREWERSVSTSTPPEPGMTQRRTTTPRRTNRLTTNTARPRKPCIRPRRRTLPL